MFQTAFPYIRGRTLHCMEKIPGSFESFQCISATVKNPNIGSLTPRVMRLKQSLPQTFKIPQVESNSFYTSTYKTVMVCCDNLQAFKILSHPYIPCGVYLYRARISLTFTGSLSPASFEGSFWFLSCSQLFSILKLFTQ